MRLFRRLVLLVLLTVPGAVRGQDVIHLVGPGTRTNAPTAPALVAERIAAAAREYEQYAPIPRAAFFDLAYPANPDEYRRMAGHGLILVTALSQSQDELPVTPYLRTAGGDVQLQLVTSVVSSGAAGDSLAAKVFGSYRIDALYLVQLDPATLGSDLLIDYARNRRAFKLGVLGQSVPGNLRDVTSTPWRGPDASQDAIVQMVKREYPGFVAAP